MSKAPGFEIFPDRDALADACAEAITGALPASGPASLVVTGGSTPGAAYDRLARSELDWSRVAVTLSDDRWVDAADPDSNERLVRQRLLTGHAAAACLIPLKGDGGAPDADAIAAEPRIAALAPFAAVLLGMGDDGHIASLFPTDPDLTARLDPDGPRWVVGVAQAGLAPYVPRISLTAHALLQSRLVIVLVTGEAKRGLLERVAADPAYHPPVAAILRQDRVPVRILWAP